LSNTLYLVRHAENWANLTKQFSHQRVDYSLTPKGVLQAQQTAEYFRNRSIDDIYSSPLKRAVATAQIVAAACGLTVKIVENFRETNTGVLEDQPPTMEAWSYHNRILADWYDGRPQAGFPGGEDYITLLARARSGMKGVVNGKDGRSVIIVGHGGMFSTTLKDLCTNVDVGWLRRANASNCSVTELSVSMADGKIEGKLVAWASTSHLQGEAAKFVPGMPGRH